MAESIIGLYKSELSGHAGNASAGLGTHRHW